MNRALKAGTVALGVVGLLVLVALASRGGHPGTGSVAPRPVPATLQDDLITLLAVAYVFTIIVVVVFMFTRRPWHAPDEQWRWLRNLVSTGIALLILTGAGYWALHHRSTAGRSSARQNVPGQATAGPRVVPSRSSANEIRSAHFQWPLALGLGGLVALGAAVLLLQDRLGERGRERESGVAEELAQVVEATLDDLRAERDPRKAVIAAYAQMERVLSSHGLSRKQAETQLEYLGRILTELEVQQPAVRRLTELFAYAKFSPHAVDEPMRDDAIEALTAVKGDLRLGERVAA